MTEGRFSPEMAQWLRVGEQVLEEHVAASISFLQLIRRLRGQPNKAALEQFQVRYHRFAGESVQPVSAWIDSMPGGTQKG